MQIVCSGLRFLLFDVAVFLAGLVHFDNVADKVHEAEHAHGEVSNDTNSIIKTKLSVG